MPIREVQVVVSRAGQPERRITLRPGVTSLGRAEDNDIILSDIGVSRRHVEIEVKSATVVVHDMKSGNGTYFNGRRIRSQEVRHGDEILIDPFLLQFQLQLDDSQRAPASPAPMLQASGVQARLLVLAGQRLNASYMIGRDGIVMGRSDQHDIVLFDPAASRRHAEIRTHDNAFWLLDNGSGNGTLVNGEQVKELRLRHGDRIRIGNTEFRFEQLTPAQGGAATQPPPRRAPASSAAPTAPPPTRAAPPQRAAPQTQPPPTPRQPPPQAAQPPAPQARPQAAPQARAPSAPQAQPQSALPPQARPQSAPRPQTGTPGNKPARPPQPKKAPAPRPAPAAAAKEPKAPAKKPRAIDRAPPPVARPKSASGVAKTPPPQPKKKGGGLVRGVLVVGVLAVVGGLLGSAGTAAWLLWPVRGSLSGPAPIAQVEVDPAAVARAEATVNRGTEYFRRRLFVGAARLFREAYTHNPTNTTAEHMAYVACEYAAIDAMQDSLMRSSTTPEQRRAVRDDAVVTATAALDGSGEMLDAGKAIEDARLYYPDDPEVIALHARVFENLNRETRDLLANLE